MNYSDPELQRRLAGEYVLGTLRGRARDRFERLARQQPRLQAEIAAWQKRLSPLAEAIPPVAPPQRVWRRVQARLGLRPPSRFSMAFWRNMSLVSTAAAAFLALYIVLVLPPTADPLYVAVIADTQTKPAWLLSTQDRRLTIKALAPIAVGNRSLELWLLPEHGNPVSLGLMPTAGSKVVSLPDAALGKLSRAQGVAVSAEPLGGSPTGLPTGPVLYQGTLIAS